MPTSPASASAAAPTGPAPFTTSTQYAATLAGTKKYLQDVNALIVLLTPPVSPASGATIARFVRLATSSNRFYVLALGHFPTLRKTLIQAVIGGANAGGGGPSTDDDDSAAALTLPYPTKMQEHLLCCFQTYRLEAGVPHTPRREEGQEGREVVRDALLVALEVVRRYMGKERDQQGGAGTGPGSWGEVCEAADVMAGLKNHPQGLIWALGVHRAFLTVDSWDTGEQHAGRQNQAAVGSLESDLADVMRDPVGNGKSPTKGA